MSYSINLYPFTTKPVWKKSLLFLTFLVLTQCPFHAHGQDSQPAKRAVMEVIERIGEKNVPDLRHDVFDVNVKKADTYILTGEVLNPVLPGILLDALKIAFPQTEFESRIIVLPQPEMAKKSYGIVNISVANMRRLPKFQAELVNQVLLGAVVRLLKEERGFYYIQNWDRYLGWISGGSIVAVDSLSAAQWQQAPRVVCQANYGIVTDSVDGDEGAFLVDLVPGATLRKLDAGDGFIKVETPDKRVGYVKSEVMVDEKKLAEGKISRESILRTAKRFLGTPYLWGGTSAKGFDCSGFVQTVFKLNNVNLPRDASQIAREGNEVDAGEAFQKLLPGDLLFFGSNANRISHVAIYLGDRLYIHSSNSVHINSLDSSHALYNDYRFNSLRTIKRLF